MAKKPHQGTVRRGFGIWLITVTVVFVLLIIVAGLFAVPAVQQFKSLAAINAAGGKFESTPHHLQAQLPSNVGLWLGGKGWLRAFDTVSMVDLGRTKVSDNDLIHLKGLTDVKKLFLQGCQVNGSGLVHLKGLDSLEAIYLYDSPLNNEGLAHLEHLPSLRKLFLSGTQVTDEGLKHLNVLTALSYLDLQGTQVSDAGLTHLRGMLALEKLSLHGTQVTEDGVIEVRANAPSLRVFR